MLTHKRLLPFVMLLFPLVFFTFQFILRLWPGLMMHSIMSQFSINATQFGMLAGAYYYGYAGMQIPIAILLDRWGARLIVASSALTCGLATLLFTFTDSFHIAVISRFLIGASSAAGFLGVSKVVSEWFPKEQYARMIGFSFTVGLMGAIYGGKPVHLLINAFQWQNVALTLGIVSLFWAVCVWIGLRAPKLEQSERSESFSLQQLKTTLSSPVIWVLALANLLMVGALDGFADVWGIPYLVEAFQLERGTAASLVSFIYFGMLVGGPLLAFGSKKFGNYLLIAGSGAGMAAAFLALLLMKSYQQELLAGLFFLVGIFCCYQVLVFAAGSDLVPTPALGFTVAFLNCINMLGGSFFHTLIGVTLDAFWTGEFSGDGVRHYSLETFQSAVSMIPLCATLGVFLVMGLHFYGHKQR
ncbi:MAG: MFS transporter [Oligoflexales bacterium]|nr:MFS transporter [Oligoflexales bacterium]